MFVTCAYVRHDLIVCFFVSALLLCFVFFFSFFYRARATLNFADDLTARRLYVCTYVYLLCLVLFFPRRVRTVATGTSIKRSIKTTEPDIYDRAREPPSAIFRGAHRRLNDLCDTFGRERYTNRPANFGQADLPPSLVPPPFVIPHRSLGIARGDMRPTSRD